MTERPILFTPENVRKLLAGEKWQTRRIMTRRNTYYDGDKWPPKGFEYYPGGHEEYQWDKAFVDPGPSPVGNVGPYLQLPVDHCDSDGVVLDHSTHRIYPRVQVGDLFWCKEAWAVDDCGSRVSMKQEAWPGGFPIDRLQYPATDKPLIGDYWWNKRSPLFMPKWAARLWLKVTRIRIERLQEISEADAIAEGIQENENGSFDAWMPHERAYTDCCETAVKAFEYLWNSIHKDKHPWEDNSWVIAYDIERTER